MDRILSSGTAMTIAAAAGDAGQLSVAAVSLGGLVRSIRPRFSPTGAAPGATPGDFGQDSTGAVGALGSSAPGGRGFKDDQH